MTATLPTYIATIASGLLATPKNTPLATTKSQVRSPLLAGQSDDGRSVSSKSTVSDCSEYAADPKEGAVSPPRFRHDPYRPAVAHRQTHAGCGVFQGISHQPLVGYCTFIQWPDHLAGDAARAHCKTTEFRVEFDQIKFELSPGQFRFVIFRLAKVVAVSAISLTPGSFTIYARNADDAAAIRALNRRCLFDQHGVWAPHNNTERTALSRYMSSREFRQRGQRLPRELMTVGRVPPPTSRSAAALSPPA
jgi:hypothetical protein